MRRPSCNRASIKRVCRDVVRWHGIELVGPRRPATPVTGFVNLFANNGKRGEPGFAFASSNPKIRGFLRNAAEPAAFCPNPQGTDQPWVGALGP